MNALIKELKENQQDFEFYPTTKLLPSWPMMPRNISKATVTLPSAEIYH